MEQNLFILACQLKLMNTIYHNFHNTVSGPCFIADHELLGGFYEEVDDDYDDVIERSVGLGLDGVADIQSQMQQVASKITQLPKDLKSEDMFVIASHLEDQLSQIIKHICYSEGVSPGVEQLIGEIDNKSDKRKYKIRQRIK